jgi:hypothetical protein
MNFKLHGIGCKSQCWKIFAFKIWKESMLVLKQTTHQQKALDQTQGLSAGVSFVSVQALIPSKF